MILTPELVVENAASDASLILKSKELLREGNLLVYEISNELNFPNPSFFSRFFKKQTGITPFQYQKQNFKGVIS